MTEIAAKLREAISRIWHVGRLHPGPYPAQRPSSSLCRRSPMALGSEEALPLPLSI